MASFNKVIVMGNLTRDPEVRTIPSGQSVCDITLAVNEKFKDKENVTFVDITVWGKQAETLARWKKKGEPLLVEGRLQMDKWQDKQSGQNRSKLKVVCVNFTFVGGGKGGGSQQGGGGQQGGNYGGGNQGQQGGNQGNQGGGNDYGGGQQGGYDDYATSFPSEGGSEPPF
ncbi:MAG: single-stranded DNA-binding protein [Planctomycetota bacterium]|jgi:single-strand DNA-binding protein